MKLDVKAMALALGLLWGLVVFGGTWWMIAFDGASDEATLIGRFYRGYTVTPWGSVIGLLWAVPDGLLGGALLAWLYNAFSGGARSVRES